MKLNLLPTYVSKQGQNQVYVILAAVILLASIGLAVLLVMMGQSAYKEALDKSKEMESSYSQALAYSAAADQVILQATDSDKHLKLAHKMAEHNTAYTKLYRTIFKFVPSYMRVNSITAAPVDGTTATVTVSGYIQTYQQYADAVMSFLRIHGVSPQPLASGQAASDPSGAAPVPGTAAASPAAVAEFKAVNVTRAGFQNEDSYVPALNELDQIGSRIKPGEQNLPSDPQARQEEIIARAQSATDPHAYLNQGNFGSNLTDRGAMPGMSLVTFVIQLSGVNLQTPDPRATVMSAGASGGASASPFGGGAPSFGGPPSFGAPTGAPAGAPRTAPVTGGAVGSDEGGGAPAGGAGRRRAGKEED